jgi:TIR domain
VTSREEKLESGLHRERRFDVALSFAGEDREYVEAVAQALQNQNLYVFYDKFEEADIAGRNLIDHLSDIYQNRARLCVLFLSKAYVSKPFPRLERRSAQARALLEEEPYIIPVRLDDAEVPGFLSMLGYVSGKTPEGLALLIAAKLRLREPEGIKTSDVPQGAQAVLARFTSPLDPDMETFFKTLHAFRHWSPTKLGSIPVELRIPQAFLRQIELAKSFRDDKKWMSPEIGDEGRAQFSKTYDETIPRLHEVTIKGIRRLISIYWEELGEDRLRVVVHRFLISQNTILARWLLDMRLRGMAPIEWEHMFAHMSQGWSSRIMMGLPYACFILGEERFLWVDADGYDTSPAIRWPQGRFRLFVPAEFVVSSESRCEVDFSSYDRFFALQFLEQEMEGAPGLPLDYFARYPNRLSLSIRGEWAYETQHFTAHSTSNSGGAPLVESVKGLRDHLTSKAGLERGSEQAAIEEQLLSLRMRRLFRSPRAKLERVLR